jgi:outer membrane lipoprotein carrier protein
MAQSMESGFTGTRREMRVRLFIAAAGALAMACGMATAAGMATDGVSATMVGCGPMTSVGSGDVFLVKFGGTSTDGAAATMTVGLSSDGAATSMGASTSTDGSAAVVGAVRATDGAMAMLAAPTRAAGSSTAIAAPVAATLGDGGAPGTAPPGSGAAAQGLLEEVLRRYARFKDFRARFTETSISRAAGEGTVESGTVSFKRPGLWRWEYAAPEKKLVIIRGTIATLQVAGEPDVARYDVGDGGQGSGLAELLEGGEGASRLFVASMPPAEADDEIVLRLDPVTLKDEYDHVLLRIGKEDLLIRGVLVEDPGGNQLRFTFERLEPNIGLHDRLFVQPEAPDGRPPS